MPETQIEHFSQPRARVIAFYLPQYHPIPENDAWWGEGFTEWTNVAKARPLFRGHYQPHIPADLGFYDLRVPETRLAQAELAKAYGVEAFCYWHYWYAGKRLLHRPFEEVLQSGEPDFPFCLAWANNDWTKHWIGKSEEMLIEQTYPGLQDLEQHFHTLLPAFTDTRYVTINQKPLFMITRPKKIPELRRATDFWRKLALQTGLKGLYLIGFHLTREQEKAYGFDAAIAPNINNYLRKKFPESRVRRALKTSYGQLFHKPYVIPYEAFIAHWEKTSLSKPKTYPSILVNWDNTPRFGNRGFVLQNSIPELFRILVKGALKQVISRPFEERLIFVKSWNEWAEGNHLEPDQRYGKAYLQIIRNEIISL